MEKEIVILEIKTSRTGEETTEAMVQFLASLTNLRQRFMLLWRVGHPISLEIAMFNQTIHFYVTCPASLRTFVEGQLTAAYPKSLIVPTKDFMHEVLVGHNTLATGQMKLSNTYLYPIKVYSEFKDIDPLASLLSALSKAQPNDRIVIQYLLNPVSSSWQSTGEHMMNKKSKDSAGVEHANPHSKIIGQKIAFHGFKTAIRIAVNSSSYERSKTLLYETANSYSSLNNPGGNGLVFKKLILWQKGRFIKVL